MTDFVFGTLSSPKSNTVTLDFAPVYIPIKLAKTSAIELKPTFALSKITPDTFSAVSAIELKPTFALSKITPDTAVSAIELKPTFALSKITPDTFSAVSAIELKPTFGFIAAKNVVLNSSIGINPAGKLEKVNLIIDIAPRLQSYSDFAFLCSYNTFDADFDKVQLLLHFNDASGTSQITDVKGHYPVGLKQTNVITGAFGSRRESVILLDGADYGGIDISPNNYSNKPSSFNLFQDIENLGRSSSVDWVFECFIGSNAGSVSEIEVSVLQYQANLTAEIEYIYASEKLTYAGQTELLKSVDELHAISVSEIPERVNIKRQSLYLQSVESAFNHGGYIASNSYSPNIDNNYSSGIDWGIRLEAAKVIVVIGDIDYPFDIPTGYVFSQWEYLRVYRENNTIGCWLNDNFLGWHEDVPTHEKRYHNYFRIGRANTKQTLRALLDEVRFTIGTSRPYDAGKVPSLPFPNIGSLEHRPKIIFEPSATFGQEAPDIVSIDLKLPRFEIKLELGESCNIPIKIPSPDIKLEIYEVEALSIASDNFVENFSIAIEIAGRSCYMAFELPKPTIKLKIIKSPELTIAGSIYEPAIKLNIKQVAEISIIATIPDLSTPALATPPISIPIAIPLPTASMAMYCNNGDNISILAVIPLPTASISISCNNGGDISISSSLPTLSISLFIEQLGFLIKASLNAPIVNITINSPPFDFSKWFDSLLAQYSSDGIFVNYETYIKPVINAPQITLEINQKPTLSINSELPKLQTTLSMNRDDNAPNRLNGAGALPALEIDMQYRVISINPITINPPIIRVQTLTSSDFL